LQSGAGAGGIITGTGNDLQVNGKIGIGVSLQK
jgi:hypothetical protein